MKTSKSESWKRDIGQPTQEDLEIRRNLIHHKTWNISYKCQIHPRVWLKKSSPSYNKCQIQMFLKYRCQIKSQTENCGGDPRGSPPHHNSEWNRTRTGHILRKDDNIAKQALRWNRRERPRKRWKISTPRQKIDKNGKSLIN